jgi:hypothetical protein
VTEVSIESAAFYEWLLSDHPDARAERGRRRAATYQDERERTGKVLAWVSKINATPDAPGTLRDLAERVGPLAANAAARAEAEFTTSDEDYVARARANWETYMQVSALDSSWDYRYPDRYIGPGAASQPRPDIRPDASAGKDRGPEAEAARDEPEIGS